MIKYKIIFSILFALQLMDAKAQKQKMGNSPKTYILTGSIDVPECDSMLIIIYKRPANLFGRYSRSEAIVKVNNSAFAFKDQSDKDDLFYVSIYPYIKDLRSYNPLKTEIFNGVYLAKSDDSIYLRIASDGMAHFYGNGANKYNLQYLVNSIPQFLGSFSISDTTSVAAFKQHANMLDSLQKLRIDLIEKMKNTVTATELDLIYLNSYFGYKAARLDFWKKELTLLRKIPILYDYIVTSYDLKSEAKDNVKIQDNIKALSYYYDDFIVHTSWVVSRNRLPNGAVDMNILPDARKAYEYIVQNYSGVLREKILICFFQGCMLSSSIGKSALPLLMDDAIGYFKNTQNIGELIDLKGRLQEKTKFIDFSLVDSKGATITPEIFNGKITLIDFWYTGCLGCAQVKRDMTVDIERLSKNDIFQMMSISIDKDRSIWKKSVDSKYYTHSESIDVNTAGLGKNHNITVRYDVTSFPRLMLVDNNGIIISMNLSPYEAIKIIEDNIKRLKL